MTSDEKTTKFLTNPMHAFIMSEWKRKEKKKTRKEIEKKNQLSVYKIEIFT